MAVTSPAPSRIAEQLLSQSAPHYSFTFTPFLQKTYQHSLPADRPICKAFQSGHCPLKTRCPERHAPPPAPASGPGSGGGHGRHHHYHQGGFGSLVCKHWLRGLCKKGDTCEFLHEYNLRRMPECSFFAQKGYCSNGDECLYLHIDPLSKVAPCPHYERGFCPLGPRCDKRHVRRNMCPFYLAGFCPDGRACRAGAHPRWVPDKQLDKPKAKEDKAADDTQTQPAKGDEGAKERERERDWGDRDRSRDRDQDGGEGRGHDRHGHKDRYGNRGGRWRGKGRFRGRNR